VILQSTGDTELTALVIASHFFALAGPIIPLLTLLKMTDFPFMDLWKQNFSLRAHKVVSFCALMPFSCSTLPGTEERKCTLIWYYFGHGVCRFTILVHLNTHRWHSSFTQVIYSFTKLRAFVESDLASSYETFTRKKREKFRIRIRNCSCMRPNIL